MEPTEEEINEMVNQDMASESTVTITTQDLIDSDVQVTTIDTTNYDANGYSLDWDNIQLTPDPDLVVIGDIIQQPPQGERINVTEIIHEQKLQIQVLSDMIQEMCEKGNFELEWNLEERMEKQRFLNKLGD